MADPACSARLNTISLLALHTAVLPPIKIIAWGTGMGKVHASKFCYGVTSGSRVQSRSAKEKDTGSLCYSRHCDTESKMEARSLESLCSHRWGWPCRIPGNRETLVDGLLILPARKRMVRFKHCRLRNNTNPGPVSNRSQLTLCPRCATEQH